jgi:hypothetical protein
MKAPARPTRSRRRELAGKLMLALAATALATLALAQIARAAWLINSQGSAGAPVSVGTATAVTVVPQATSRYAWMIRPETADIRCVVGTPPPLAPSATAGILVPAGTWWGDGPRTMPGGADLDARVDCIGVSAPTLVDTQEEQ